MKITIEKIHNGVQRIEMKRFYPPFDITWTCPSCEAEHDFEQYFSLPPIGKEFRHDLYCPECDMEFPIKFKLNLELAKARPIETLYSFEKVRVMRRYVMALCPFHSEKTPSFYIYKDNNKYKCFGCGVHGDAIDFVSNVHRLNFVDAVKFLMN